MTAQPRLARNWSWMRASAITVAHPPVPNTNHQNPDQGGIEQTGAACSGADV